MADFRYYCEEHHMVYGMVRLNDGTSVFGCRKCVEAAYQKARSTPPVASDDAQAQSQNERINDAEEAK